jgi:hypothetical protein
VAVRESPGQTALGGGLAVSSFGLTGWKDESFHYRPTLSVTVPSEARPVFVQQIDFTAVVGGRSTSVGGLRYGVAKLVGPGQTLDLMTDSSYGSVAIVTAEPLGTVMVTVSYADETGIAGTATANAETPDVVAGSIATLAIRSFTVTGWTQSGRFHYWPKLTLAETSGSSRAVIKQMVFELVDTGPQGKVPIVWNPAQVPAGGTLTLDEGGYGDPWLEIDSTSANASRVSVVISYVDEQGRGGSISAVADVSR